MALPRVFADFHNADPEGRLRLNCVGTIQDLNRQQLVLDEGIQLEIYSESLAVPGIVHYSPDERIWVATIDWQAIREMPISEETATPSPKRQIA